MREAGIEGFQIDGFQFPGIFASLFSRYQR